MEKILIKGFAGVDLSSIEFSCLSRYNFLRWQSLKKPLHKKFNL